MPRASNHDDAHSARKPNGFSPRYVHAYQTIHGQSKHDGRAMRRSIAAKPNEYSVRTRLDGSGDETLERVDYFAAGRSVQLAVPEPFLRELKGRITAVSMHTPVQALGNGRPPYALLVVTTFSNGASIDNVTLLRLPSPGSWRSM